MTSVLRKIENVTCLGCGCACDDIGVVVDDSRIRDTPNACELGGSWFRDGRVPAQTSIDGRVVSIDDAVLASATLLESAARPLVYLAPGISCETQREATSIADLLRARLDSVTSATALPVLLSAQERGFASATLGEIRNRADVIVFWAVDLDARYPRFGSRYAPDPVGTHVPEGRRGRHVLAVDVGAATTLRDADRRIAFGPDDELGTLAALQALVCHPEEQRDEGSGVRHAWAIARRILPSLLDARYLALVYDAEPDDREARSPQRFDALASLSQALNERTRCASIALRAGGNRSGADSVLTSQTGFPVAVDFGHGYPRYLPQGGAALSSLQSADVDAALVIGDASLIPVAVHEALGKIRCIVIGPRASTSPLGSASVVVDTGIAGIHDGGTVLRTDDVPLSLRPSVPGPRSALAVVSSLARAIASAQRNHTSSPAATT